jgi:hypothetical protein
MTYYTISHRSPDSACCFQQIKCLDVETAIDRMMNSAEAQGFDPKKINRKQIDLMSSRYTVTVKKEDADGNIKYEEDPKYQYIMTKHFN